MQGTPPDIETRINISLAISRYLRAADRFQTASLEFTEACTAVRTHLSAPSRFVARIDYRHYLITSDDSGNFEIEQIESL